MDGSRQHRRSVYSPLGFLLLFAATPATSGSAMSLPSIAPITFALPKWKNRPSLVALSVPFASVPPLDVSSRKATTAIGTTWVTGRRQRKRRRDSGNVPTRKNGNDRLCERPCGFGNKIWRKMQKPRARNRNTGTPLRS